MSRRHPIVPCLIALVLAAPTRADVSLPPVLGDHMVLQRDAMARVWGWARADEEVTVAASWGAVVTTRADDRGRWSVRLATVEAGGPHTVTITGDTTITLSDVLLGEVWVCSGQSNMEWRLEQTAPGYRGAVSIEEEITTADYPSIRLFTVPNTRSAPRRGLCEGAWTRCTPETARRFSAVGYFFGREISEELGVPVGLISADWGGTVAEAWTSAEGLAEFPEFADSITMLDALADPTRRTRYVREHVDGWWDKLDGKAPGGAAWRDPGHDDAGWATMAVPSTWGGELGRFDGVGYLRRSFDLPADAAGAPGELHLGPIDDYDDVWVNGEPVGSEHRSGQWNQPRTYAIPRGVLRAGSNVIAVRVLDTGGLAGMNGTPDQLRLTAGAATVDLAGTWRFARGAPMSELGSLPGGVNFGPNTPTVLFNGMIAPLTNYTMRGAIWYQGESNRTRARQYRRLFPAMIADWRRQWGIGDFPFYFVQIAPFRYGGDRGEAAELREAQMMTLAVPNTGMAVTMDIGNPADIHPKNKQDVGHRLALLARAQTYGERGLAYSGPAYRDHAVEGNAIRLRFDHAGGGLELRDSGRRNFWIAGADRRFVPGDAQVIGDSVVVTGAGVARPVAVRYAWEAAAEGNLFNRDGLPASSFRTDDWDGPMPPVDNDAEARSYRTDEPGFVPLFNERDLTGWVNVNGAPGTWRVKDGVIACSGIPTGVLRTETQYENFIMELEWRHLRPGGNAGVFVWSDPLPARGQPYTRGIEVQVLDGQQGSWYTSDGDIFPIHGARMTPENGREGSRAFPTEARSNSSPLWNHYRIECVDGSIALAVNGKVVTRGHDASPRKGYICLESEGSPIEFRRILIKPLPSSAALTAADVADAARGFRTLYSGVDFAGWKHTPEHGDHWKAANWKIAFDGVGPHLWSQESFGDFELRCDWRWAGPAKEGECPVVLPNGDQPGTTVRVMDAGDSGIYLRGSSKSQVNIWCWPIGSGEVYGYRTDRSMPPEVRAGVTPAVAADAPIGEWNRFEITMVGEELTVVLNGQTVLDHARLPGVAATGPIALQRHGSPIEFANIYVRAIE